MYGTLRLCGPQPGSRMRLELRGESGDLRVRRVRDLWRVFRLRRTLRRVRRSLKGHGFELPKVTARLGRVAVVPC